MLIEIIVLVGIQPMIMKEQVIHRPYHYNHKHFDGELEEVPPRTTFILAWIFEKEQAKLVDCCLKEFFENY